MLAIRIFVMACIDLRHIDRNDSLLAIPTMNLLNGWLDCILFICCSQGHHVWYLRGHLFCLIDLDLVDKVFLKNIILLLLNPFLIELKLGNRTSIPFFCAQIHSTCFNCSLLFIPFSLYLLILFFQYSDQLIIRLSTILWSCHDFLFSVLAFTRLHL